MDSKSLAELKEACKVAGLPVSGTKAILLQRLQEHEAKAKQVASVNVNPMLRSGSMASLRPKAISLFSGAGGDTLGLKRAGYDVVAFSEFKQPAIDTHLAEFPLSVLLKDPVSGSCDISKIPDSVFSPYHGTIDTMFMGCPCQSYSHGGKKDKYDPRGQLYHQGIRAVRLIQPKYVIFENVRGLLSRVAPENDHPEPDMRKRPCVPVIENIRREFAKINYTITYKVIDVEKIGVPQLRKRLILIATPSLGNDRYPHMPWDNLPEASVPASTSIRGYLEPTLEGAIEYDVEKIPKDLDGRFWIQTDATAPTGTPHKNLVRLVNGIRNMSSKELAAAGKGAKERIVVVEKDGLISFGRRAGGYHGEVVDPDAPSKTIICTYGLCPRLFVGLVNPTLGKYWIRTLTIRELGMIQGFPGDYAWKGSVSEKITQIGNAVPPSLAERVARALGQITYCDTPQVVVGSEGNEGNEGGEGDGDEEEGSEGESA